MNSLWQRIRGNKARDEPARRLTHTQRKLLASACAGLAVAVIAFAALPRPHGDSVVVASAHIEPGATITADTVTTRLFPPQLVPDNAVTDPAEVVGTTSASSLDAGTPITKTALLETAPANIPEGFVRVPISVGDPATASVLRPGHRIQVYSATDQDARSLVDEALVVSVTTVKDSFAGETRIVTLAVKQSEAPKLAGNAGLSFGLLGENGPENVPSLMEN